MDPLNEYLTSLMDLQRVEHFGAGPDSPEAGSLRDVMDVARHEMPPEFHTVVDEICQKLNENADMYVSDIHETIDSKLQTGDFGGVATTIRELLARGGATDVMVAALRVSFMARSKAPGWRILFE